MAFFPKATTKTDTIAITEQEKSEKKIRKKCKDLNFKFFAQTKLHPTIFNSEKKENPFLIGNLSLECEVGKS